ncbi:MAG: hypothetical protein IJY36_07570 [Coprobacter sp.]|nr:hypothetical protein [Coprobacter sp.]
MKLLKHIIRTLFALLALVCTTSCEEEVEDFIGISPVAELYFDCVASSDTLTVESSGVWSVSGMPEWCEVSPVSGGNDDRLIIAIAANDESDERSALFSITSGTATATISVTQYGRIDSDYVELNIGKPGVSTTYDSASGALTVSYSAQTPPSVTEGSAIVLPVEYGYDIRVVESVATSGNTVLMQTTQGNMCNLFRNTSFTLTTEPSTRVRSSVGGERVIAPSSYGYIDSDGRYHEVYNSETGYTTRANYIIRKKLWSFHTDLNGSTIYNGTAGRLWWETCAYDADLKGSFEFDFGEKEISLFRKEGELKRFSYTLTGNIGMDMLLKYHYENRYTEEGDTIIKYNVLPTGIFTFPVGGVTVHLLIYTHLGKYTMFTAEGSIDASAGVKMGMELNAGLEWTSAGGVKPIRSAVPTLEVHAPTIEAKASATAKVSYYPQIEIGLYKFIGPWLEPRPYIKETVEAGARLSADGDNHIGWTSDMYAGMDIRMGLKFDFGFWDKEVWRSDVHNLVSDKSLYTSPQRITRLSPENGMKVAGGESVTAEFLVESYSPVTKKYYPCPLALVNFSADGGELSHGVATADLAGKVRVEWTPSPRTTRGETEYVPYTLTARVVDKSGETIDEATLLVNSEKPIHEAIDLGLSVKWAGWNIGAASPEEYGGYYAWGETEEKSDYTLANYKYWTDSNGNGDWDYDEFTHIGNNISGTQYDVAHVKWGGGWRMPTLEEIKELVNSCTWEWGTYKGVSGQYVTGPNGNSIFLPAAGYRGYGELYDEGTDGYYWSAALGGSYGSYACTLYFDDGYYRWDGWSRRYFGLSVRAVTE